MMMTIKKNIYHNKVLKEHKTTNSQVNNQHDNVGDDLEELESVRDEF